MLLFLGVFLGQVNQKKPQQEVHCRHFYRHRRRRRRCNPESTKMLRLYNKASVFIAHHQKRNMRKVSTKKQQNYVIPGFV